MNTSTNIMMKKKTQGRKKIEIKKIEKPSNRHVTFSKRRSGLFKKAGELSILTGAEAAIIVQSPGGRVFAFGHPSVDAVVDRYLAGSSGSQHSVEDAINDDHMHEFKKRYSEVSEDLEAERKRKVAVEEAKRVSSGGYWWNEPVDDLGLEELERYMASLEELKKKMTMRADELMMNRISSSKSSFLEVNRAPNNIGLADYGDAMIPRGFVHGHGQI
ncbi:unnamed protein product [Ilex paraguariensis]|uniref:MADS-box domain-containing protein n=1 Tax=Ilex paraguariensis TaxID=185542 RepID=A0ABC8TJX2_9AQUA